MTAIRERLDRRRLLIAIGAAVLFHFLIVLGAWIADRYRVRDIGDWSGPVLVKIGIPEGMDSPLPDPGPIPEQPDVPEETPPEEIPVEPETPVQESVPQTTPPPEEVPSETGSRPVPEETPPPAETPVSPEPVAPVTPPPARVRGSEHGNSYQMDFEGAQGEVGRAGALNYITDYMPLPESFSASLLEGASSSRWSEEDILEWVGRYWELSFGEYYQKADVPLVERPEYWSLFVNVLGYDLNQADWKGYRPVTVEFTVEPSRGASGAELSDFRLVNRTNDPKVDEAILYGISRWIYYNDSGSDIRGRITYNFDR